MAYAIELTATEVPMEIQNALEALETALRDEVLRRIADNPETEHEQVNCSLIGNNR
jgi:predicted nucleic acid-binding Zn ribbon protein